VIGKKPFVKGGIKLGFAGDKGLAEIKLRVPAAKGYGKLIPDNRPGPGFGKIRAWGRFRFLLSLMRRLGFRFRLGFLLRFRFRRGFLPGFRLGLDLRLRPGLDGRGGSGFFGRNNFGDRFTSGKGKQSRPYQEP
jgi:hypothetical protein